MTADLTPTSAPYRDAAPIYLDAGWLGTLPLGARQKERPPTGYTGADGGWPTPEIVDAWRTTHRFGNICVRFPDGIVGIDVDQYDEMRNGRLVQKRGADTSETFRARHGLDPLPPTWTSSAREAPSRVLLFRVPPGWRMRDDLLHVDALQRHHRYMVVEPSVHPDTGTVYLWRNAEDEVTHRPPRLEEIPWLPEEWLEALAEGSTLDLPPEDPAEAPQAPVTASVAPSLTLVAPEVPRQPSQGDRAEALRILGLAEAKVAGTLPGGGGTSDRGRNQTGNNETLSMRGLAMHGVLNKDEVYVALTRAMYANGYIEEHGLQAWNATFRSAWNSKNAKSRKPWPPETVGEGYLLPFADGERVYVVEAAPPSAGPDTFTARSRSGGAYILSQPEVMPAIWGRGDEVLWAEGEPLIICAPPGVGKTTVAGQVVWGSLGLVPEVLGLPVKPVTEGKVLYLACDRPRQIGRAFARLATPEQRETLDEHLVVWEGPPPFDFATHPETLLRLAAANGCTRIFIDSLKDVALNLSEDAAGSGYNRSVQRVVAEGIDVCTLHHQRKGSNGEKPKRLEDVYGSTWITSGAGSVVLLWGTAGDAVVEMIHLKQPAAVVGPWKVEHDHYAGTSQVTHGFDLLAYLGNVGLFGATVLEAARAKTSKAKPTENEQAQVRASFARLVASGKVVKEGEGTGGASGTPARRYRLASSALRFDG